MLNKTVLQGLKDKAHRTNAELVGMAPLPKEKLNLEHILLQKTFEKLPSFWVELFLPVLCETVLFSKMKRLCKLSAKH